MSSDNGFFHDLVPPVDQLKRIGPIFDRETYLATGKRSVDHLVKYADLRPAHSVLDIGCGFGRVAIQLLRVLSSDAAYFGVDVVKEEIAWCQENITPRNAKFIFAHVDARNAAYNPSGKLSADEVALPVPSGQKFDLAYLFSVFTHMLPQQVENYIKDIHRHLKPGGTLFATFFVINDESKHLMGSHERAQFQFVKQRGGYYTANTEVHEGAVAYDEQDVWRMMMQAGFIRGKAVFGHWPGARTSDHGQDFIVCTMPR
jgi:cyclopropane fatty-acyl-phospholipid synthase-like methyltransferase